MLLNPFGEVVDGLRRLRAERPLWLTVIGISFFWFLGALVQINLLFFGKELLQLDEFHIGLLGTFLAIGIGAGIDCDGQVLVMHDLLGLEDRIAPKFVKRYAELGLAATDAFARYVAEVRGGHRNVVP